MNKPLFIFKNIWLADDDPDDATFFEDAILEVFPGASVLTIPNGEELLSHLDAGRPDFLFLDLNMPLLDGRDSLRSIREKAHCRQLPIIVYSSSPHDNDLMICYGLGANLYVRKPNRYGDIVRTIKEIFQLDWQSPATIASQFFVDNKYVPFRAQS